jgi:hypothetical protein
MLLLFRTCRGSHACRHLYLTAVRYLHISCTGSKPLLKKFEVLVTRRGRLVLHLKITGLGLKSLLGQPTIYDVHIYICALFSLLACVRIDTHEWTEFARALTGEEEENRAQQDRVFPAACGSPQWQIRLSFYHHGSRDPHNARRTDPRTPRPTAQAAHYARDVGAGGAPSVRTTRSRRDTRAESA